MSEKGKHDILPCLVIAGATASGKSALALAIAEMAGGEVINADSMQVYCDLPLLTATPEAAEQARIPHHGYGVVDGGMRFSVGAWLEQTRDSVHRVRKRGKIPILVGGTGMYIRAAIEGIAPIPDISAEARRQATEMLASQGGAAFRRTLGEHDPQLARRLDDNDSQRLTRGMEVFLSAGKPLSLLQQAPPTGMITPPIMTLLVCPPRDILYDRIDRRFPGMLEAGGLAEAERFAARGLDASLPLMKALGLAPLMAHLDGKISCDEAISIACRDTRHFAKRQLTWFRHQYSADFHFETAEDINIENAQLLKRFLSKNLPNIVF